MEFVNDLPRHRFDEGGEFFNKLHLRGGSKYIIDGDFNSIDFFLVYFTKIYQSTNGVITGCFEGISIPSKIKREEEQDEDCNYELCIPLALLSLNEFSLFLKKTKKNKDFFDELVREVTIGELVEEGIINKKSLEEFLNENH